MFQRIVVPVDGSKRSWVAANHGAALARATDAQLEIVNVVFDERHRDHARRVLHEQLVAEQPSGVDPVVVALVGSASDESVGSVIARHAESAGRALVVMSSTGRGRTAAMLGSVADEVLRAMFDPIVVVGPHVERRDSLAGDIVVPVDGSEFSETSLPIAASWGRALGATPWIVGVSSDRVEAGDAAARGYPQRLARELGAQSHGAVEFDLIQGRDAAKAIASYSARNKAMFVLMSTHGRSGVRRLTLGSTAASVVHHSVCPVALHRPPRFRLSGPG